MKLSVFNVLKRKVKTIIIGMIKSEITCHLY